MTEEEIQYLIYLDLEVLNAYYPYLAAQIQQQVALGSFTGLSVEQIVANITDATLSEAQIQTLISTSLNNYSRTVTYGIMQEEPADFISIYRPDRW